ncbi:unnamed protein product [Ectocarpus sp. CCAP 1310/34]|nr:unnamed protein product [Ectocarpus sp. CCAP 1310/34]
MLRLAARRAAAASPAFLRLVEARTRGQLGCDGDSLVRLRGLAREWKCSTSICSANVESADMLSLLHSGIVVICYFSAGTYEEYRDDEADFPRSALGNRVEHSVGTWWININDEDIKPVMEGRLDLASEKGCDAVDPDFMESYTFSADETGWNITADEQLEYNKWIADQAHARNLSVGLKNDRLQMEELEPWFDWALSTDCYDEEDCGSYGPFVTAGKAVLDAEFAVQDLGLCNDTLWHPIDFIVKSYELDEQRCSCGFPETNFECDEVLAGHASSSSSSTGGGTTSHTSGGGSAAGTDDSGEGQGGDGTPTWVIVTAIAVAVLAGMMAYGAMVWRRRRGKDKKVEGVDDFCDS